MPNTPNYIFNIDTNIADRWTHGDAEDALAEFIADQSAEYGQLSAQQALSQIRANEHLIAKRTAHSFLNSIFMLQIDPNMDRSEFLNAYWDVINEYLNELDIQASEMASMHQLD